MNILLIFFAIPIATIILSAIFETFIHCPIKISGISFSIFIVLAFELGGTAELLVAAIIYTIISFITAYIVMIFRERQEYSTCNGNFNVNNTNLQNADNNVTTNNITSDNTNLTQNLNNLETNNFNNGCCRRYR